MPSITERKNLREAIDAFPKSTADDMEAGKQAKRSNFSSSTLRAVNIIEWIAARHFPFTTLELADELELSDSSARQHLRTIETVGWVKRSDNVDKSVRGNPQHTYLSKIRLRRI